MDDVLERKPKVLLLVNRWYKDGGVENFLEQLIFETKDHIDYSICSLITSVCSVADCKKIGPVLTSGHIQDMFIHGNLIEDAMRLEKYDVIHIQASNGSAFYLANLAKRVGISKRIIHSHNAGAETSVNPVKKIIGRVTANIFSNAATDLWACSTNAGEYLFGNRNFEVFFNGVDIEKFSFSQNKRTRVRDELGIDDETFLLGSIGRISFQKNPIFQLRVFSELLKIMPTARFCMVGSGDMEKERNIEIQKLGISKSVILIPRTSESDAFYSAFDALLFPPVFEGLSFVGIEAQVAGLPIFASVALPRELDVTDRISFFSLKESPAYWAQCISVSIEGYNHAERLTYAKKMSEAGFEKGACFITIAKAYGNREING